MTVAKNVDSSVLKDRGHSFPEERPEEIDRPIVFEATKDKPVLLSAIGANADYLVTSDKADFGHVLGTVADGVNIRTPKTFLLEMGLVE